MTLSRDSDLPAASEVDHALVSTTSASEFMSESDSALPVILPLLEDAGVYTSEYDASGNCARVAYSLETIEA
jgi:hypothetical protein